MELGSYVDLMSKTGIYLESSKQFFWNMVCWHHKTTKNKQPHPLKMGLGVCMTY